MVKEFKYYWINKLFIKGSLRKVKNRGSSGLRKQIKIILGCLKRGNIMDKGNWKQSSRFMRGNFKMDKNMDLEKNFIPKQESK